MDHIAPDSTWGHRARAAAVAGLIGQLLGDVVFTLFLFSPLARMGLGLSHPLIALMFIGLPVPVGAAIGWFHADRTTASIGRLAAWMFPLWKGPWLPDGSNYQSHQARWLRRPTVVAALSGLVVFVIDVGFNIAARHASLVQALVVGAIVGAVTAFATRYGLVRRDKRLKRDD
jgi:hypothetical protein